MGICPLAFPETVLVRLAYSQNAGTLYWKTVGKGDPYLLHRDTYGVETEDRFLFPTTPLTMVLCSVLRKREMRKAFVSQLLLEHFSCIEGCGSQRQSQS